MSEEQQLENIETWLSKKPYWEQKIWYINTEKKELTQEDEDICYKYLLDFLGINKIELPKNEFDFNNKIVFKSDSVNNNNILLIKLFDIKNVNAITNECVIKFGKNITIIYGKNAAGKSGISRLLCNACFSRGNREIINNINIIQTQDKKPEANFTIQKNSNNVDIHYVLGNNYNELKSFSVFDRKSVLIHLDESNTVNLVPSQIKVFDKVTETISKVEKNFNEYLKSNRRENPFIFTIVFDETSKIKEFCDKISDQTSYKEFLRTAKFEEKKDANRIKELETIISEKIKMNIPEQKKKLLEENENLNAFKASLSKVDEILNSNRAEKNNILIDKYNSEKTIAEANSITQFKNSDIMSIGTEEWKSLIKAANILYDEEVKISKKDIEYCLLCQQKLGSDKKSLFKKYWTFLKSKSEDDLEKTITEIEKEVKVLETLEIQYPKFIDTDTGIKTLRNENKELFENIKKHYENNLVILKEWIKKLKTYNKIISIKISTCNLELLDGITQKNNSKYNGLNDPTDEIDKLKNELILLKHKKILEQHKSIVFEYIKYLKLLKKAQKVNFSGIKSAITRKRTEFIKVGIAENYKHYFNKELEKLGSNFNLVMWTSGEEGKTKKEFKLEYAEDYNPSQILSEGEQNVCSIADFLTEVNLEKGSNAIIFDDPVSSLDHERKEKIAKRLVEESKIRQVIIFSHDIVFLSYITKNSVDLGIDLMAHWMKAKNGIPGFVEENSSPKLACLTTLKQMYTDIFIDFESKSDTEKEKIVGNAFDFLRSACEALIEEVIFSNSIKRWDDQIRVNNIDEAVLDKSLLCEIIEIFNEISENGLMHNISDEMRESPYKKEKFDDMRGKFELILSKAKSLQSATRKEKDSKQKQNKKTAW